MIVKSTQEKYLNIDLNQIRVILFKNKKNSLRKSLLKQTLPVVINKTYLKERVLPNFTVYIYIFLLISSDILLIKSIETSIINFFFQILVFLCLKHTNFLIYSMSKPSL